MKKVLVGLYAIALAGCMPALPAFLGGPAPLAVTTIDEKALIIALQTFDTVLTGIDRLIAAGVIKPGSPVARQIADDISDAKAAFNAANAAQKAGNARSYTFALGQAQIAIADINAMIKGK